MNVPVSRAQAAAQTAPAIDALTVNAVLVAVRQAANVLCDRWSLLTLLLAHAGVHRYNGFSERSRMASRLLTSRLAMLQEQGIIVPLLYSRRPPRHEYHLSHMGGALFEVFATMAHWERKWHGHTGLRLEHLACGVESAVALPHCAACQAPLQATDIRLSVSQRRLQPMPAKETTTRRSTHGAIPRGGSMSLPLAHAIDVFGDKWGIELVMCLFSRVRRFSDFQIQLGIATNILADRLARLAALGIVRPTTEADRYGKGGYALTDKGIDLHPILLAIQAWADAWLPDRRRSPVKLVHRPCGQVLQLRLCCDQCGQPLERGNSRLVIDRAGGERDKTSTP